MIIDRFNNLEVKQKVSHLSIGVFCFGQGCHYDILSRHYGNTGYRVFKEGIQNWKYFCLKINIPKGNDEIFRISVI